MAKDEDKKIITRDMVVRTNGMKVPASLDYRDVMETVKVSRAKAFQIIREIRGLPVGVRSGVARILPSQLDEYLARLTRPLGRLQPPPPPPLESTAAQRREVFIDPYPTRIVSTPRPGTGAGAPPRPANPNVPFTQARKPRGSNRGNGGGTP